MLLVLIGLALIGFLGGFSGGITGYYIRKYVEPWLKERASAHS
jgi:membrane protein YqaA with SNARE-associated domain